MSSLYAKYIQEREGKSILELEHGYATYYYVNEDTVYIEDIFVEKEYRKTGLGKKLGDLIVKGAKSKGCTQLLGSVDVRANGATDSSKFLFSYGMQLHSTNGNMIYFIKNI
jgi:predicted GNAT family acetyltransferase